MAAFDLTSESTADAPFYRGRYEWRSAGDFDNQFRVLMYSAVDAPLAGDDSAPGLAFYCYERRGCTALVAFSFSRVVSRTRL